MRFFFCFFFITVVGFSQAPISFNDIPADLKKNVNSVVQHSHLEIDLVSTDKMILKNEIVITVLNKNGNRHIDPSVSYDRNTKIKSLEAIVHDKYGKEIKKYKKRDFLDLSAVDGGTLYSDDRLMYFNYTPDSYPYTVVLKYEVESSNTAYIRPFFPITSYNMSVISSTYSLNIAPDIDVKHQLEDPMEIIQEEKSSTGYIFKAENVKGIKPENSSPRFSKLFSHVNFSMNFFELEGVKGVAKDWSQFGKWIHTSLLSDVSNLSDGKKQLIRDYVRGETTIEGKAKKVYQYVQENTRYISVQIGIGGWKPISAAEVASLGYGDCKGLTNYTKALLEAVDVPSYYSIIYAGNQQRDISADFASLQGNHVILAVPNEEETIWLECTSQKMPFGFLGDFTDDRDALMITPEGGKIVHTPKYSYETNKLITTGNCKLDSDGNINVSVKLESFGIQYDQRYSNVYEETDSQKKFYKNYWDYIDNITIESMNFQNDRESVRLSEEVNFNANSYTSNAGDNVIFNVNVLNRATYIPKRYKNRKLPLYLSRGFLDEDEVIIELPIGYKLSSFPEPIMLESSFGRYSSSIEKNDNGNLVYKRKFELHSGVFPKEEYSKYRDFRKKIAKSDNQKLVFAKK